jgi:hypothetical protein
MYADAWYVQYGPYICIGVLIVIIFILWIFFSNSKHKFVGLSSFNSETHDDGHNNDDYLEPETDNNDNNKQPKISIDNTPMVSNTYTEKLSNKICIKEVSHERPKTKNRVCSHGEKICCRTMEKIYGVSFNSVWPNWLVNPETKRKLELDCYNSDLKLAVEYNGEQHYKWPNFTGQTYEEFINQVRRDDLKRELCDAHGVYLITVPYKVSHDNIPRYIVSQLPETIQNKLHDNFDDNL